MNGLEFQALADRLLGAVCSRPGVISLIFESGKGDRRGHPPPIKLPWPASQVSVCYTEVLQDCLKVENLRGIRCAQEPVGSCGKGLHLSNTKFGCAARMEEVSPSPN